jgi:rhodanese-related sulfurtransferase
VTREKIEIQPTELKQKLEQIEVGQKQDGSARLLLLDVREPWEFQTAHLEGATLIPLGHLPEHLDELEKEQEIVVLCHHGVRSLNATLYLRQLGFKNVKSLVGGIDLWSQTIDPKVPRY